MNASFRRLGGCREYVVQVRSERPSLWVGAEAAGLWVPLVCGCHPLPPDSLQGTCMKLEQRVAATTASMCPYGMALMTRVSSKVFTLLTGPLLSLLELTSSVWYFLQLG